MELQFKGRDIIFDKELNHLDKLAIDFCAVLNKLKVKYVIISGYEAILFGRNRASEDIDMFIEKLSKEKFGQLWEGLQKEGFWCMNAEMDEAFSLLEDWLAPRFARKGEAYPNMEVKYAQKDLDFYSLSNKVKVILRGSEIYIGPLELNIAFKLRLGTDKDIEDARFLYKLFGEKLHELDKESLLSFVRLMKVEDKAREYLWTAK